MKKLVTLFVILSFVLNTYTTEAQINKAWWSKLPIEWKEVFCKELGWKGKPEDLPEDFYAEFQQIDRLVIIGNDKLTSLEPVSKLTALLTLNISKCKNIKSLDPVGQLKLLKILDCSFIDNITSLEPLKNLTTLEKLNCQGTTVISLNPLISNTNLKEIYAQNTVIRDLNVIPNLLKLEVLNVSDNLSLRNLDPMKNVKSLREFYCNNTKIESVEPIQDLTNLEVLEFAHTPVNTLKFLAGLVNLRQINCSVTEIKNLAGIFSLPAIQKFTCTGNDLTDGEISRFKKTLPKCETKFEN